MLDGGGEVVEGAVVEVGCAGAVAAAEAGDGLVVVEGGGEAAFVSGGAWFDVDVVDVGVGEEVVDVPVGFFGGSLVAVDALVEAVLGGADVDVAFCGEGDGA